MSFRNKVLDRENVTSRAGKAVLQPTKPAGNTQRSALGEVGNKIHINTGQNVTKPKDFKVASVGVIKKTNVPVKKSASVKIIPTKTEKVSIRPETNAVAVKKPTNVECITKKNENVCVKPGSTVISRSQNRELVKLPSLPSIQEPSSYSTKQLVGIIDVDTSDNPLHVSEYVQDIYNYLLELETRFPVEEDFLEEHKSTPRMRAVLVNWMVEIHINFKLLLETLHLSVSIVDRYLQSNKGIGRQTLQLVGTVAMWIAGKYEEMYLPDLKDFVYICDNTFTKEQLLTMEVDILKKLEFNMGRPFSLQFLRRFNRIAGVQANHHNLGKYMLELALMDYKICQIKPSVQAAAACCLAISILDSLADPSLAWTKTLVHYTSYKYSDIKPVIIIFAQILNKAETSKHQCIRTKYSSANYSKISVNAKLKGQLMKKLIAQAAINKT